MVEKFDGMKVFSATKANEREVLGEKVTEWLKKNPKIVIVDKVITQSSDSEFHCLAITLFYTGEVLWNHPPTPRMSNNDYKAPRT